MIRVKRGNVALKRRKRYLRLAKGYVGSNSRLSIFATEQVVQSLQFAYIGRKLKKRNFRKLWIYRINAVSRKLKMHYSALIGSLLKENILLDRKILSFLAFHDLPVFTALAQTCALS